MTQEKLKTIIYKEDGIEIVFTDAQMLCSQRTCDWECNRCKVGKKAIKRWREIKEGKKI
jgi:Tfp pilus assembly pilus retraction ATPase PilT